MNKQSNNLTMKQSRDVPHHIAIIMDGNRRWAKEHGLPPLSGHRRVTDEILEPLIEYASTKGVEYMTFWAWSTENWERNKKEVRGIMRLFRRVIQRKLDRLHKKGVCVRVIGDISKFDPDIQKGLRDVVEKTKNNRVITAVFALNYGGRDEIMRSMKRMTLSIIEDSANNRELHQQFSNVTIKQLASFLDTASIPDPDIIVRTGGEQRLSGFLLWQSEYSELYFPTWHMPDFTNDKLDEIIAEYGRRRRRFGK